MGKGEILNIYISIAAKNHVTSQKTSNNHMKSSTSSILMTRDFTQTRSMHTHCIELWCTQTDIKQIATNLNPSSDNSDIKCIILLMVQKSGSPVDISQRFFLHPKVVVWNSWTTNSISQTQQVVCCVNTSPALASLFSAPELYLPEMKPRRHGQGWQPNLCLGRLYIKKKHPKKCVFKIRFVVEYIEITIYIRIHINYWKTGT